MPPAMTTGTIAIRLDMAMKRRLEALAKADERSLSSYIKRVLVGHLDGLEKPARRTRRST